MQIINENECVHARSICIFICFVYFDRFAIGFSVSLGSWSFPSIPRLSVAAGSSRHSKQCIIYARSIMYFKTTDCRMDPVLADCSLRQIVCRVWLSFIHKIPYFTSGNSFVRQILYLFYHTLDWRLESLVTPLAASRGLTQFAVRFKIKLLRIVQKLLSVRFIA